MSPWSYTSDAYGSFKLPNAETNKDADKKVYRALRKFSSFSVSEQFYTCHFFIGVWQCKHTINHNGGFKYEIVLYFTWCRLGCSVHGWCSRPNTTLHILLQIWRLHSGPVSRTECFTLHCLERKFPLQQESIPVGCVPPACLPRKGG